MEHLTMLIISLKFNENQTKTEEIVCSINFDKQIKQCDDTCNNKYPIFSWFLYVNP